MNDAWPLVAMSLLCIAYVTAIGFCIHYKLKIDRTRRETAAELERINAEIDSIRRKRLSL